MQKIIKLELLEDLLLSNFLITEKNIKKKIFIETIIYNEIFQTTSKYNKYIILNEFELLKSIKQLIKLLELKLKLKYNLIILFEDEYNYDIFKYYYQNLNNNNLDIEIYKQNSQELKNLGENNIIIVFGNFSKKIYYDYILKKVNLFLEINLLKTDNIFQYKIKNTLDHIKKIIFFLILIKKILIINKKYAQN